MPFVKAPWVLTDLGRRERMTRVQGAVHVGVGHGAEELGGLGLVLGGSVELEHLGVGPFLLVFLLVLDEGIALLGLSPGDVSLSEVAGRAS